MKIIVLCDLKEGKAMTITEIINRLEELKDRFGDLYVLGYETTSDKDFDIKRIDFITSQETKNVFRKDQLAIHLIG